MELKQIVKDLKTIRKGLIKMRNGESSWSDISDLIDDVDSLIKKLKDE